MNRIVVVYSGGLDSTTLLVGAMYNFAEVRALGFNYGQRHVKELHSAALICNDLDIPFEIADLSNITQLLGGSSQTDLNIPVPEGHYADETMKATVVPNRNMIMASVAIGYAVSIGYDTIGLGVHAGDHAIYPDCRPEFIQALNHIALIANYAPVNVYAPFLEMSKAEIIQAGDTLSIMEIEVPYAKTWSCYKGLELHCGVCGTCVERKEAFKLARVYDPTVYAAEEAA